MKYIVITDEPIVLEKIKLQGHNEIRELSDEDHIGESGIFTVTQGIYNCPKCHMCVGTINRTVKYCCECGCFNEDYETIY